MVIIRSTIIAFNYLFVPLFVAAKYCPVTNGVMCTCIVVTGREGVWRLQHFDLDTTSDEVMAKVSSDHPPMQPEFNNEFVLVELSVGKQ